jgi:hypothetical protein
LAPPLAVAFAVTAIFPLVVGLHHEARAADTPLAGAPADGGRRVVVRAPDATSRALLQRIRGQTSDLDQEIVEASQPAMEPRIGDELATARQFASRYDARVVVWFETTGDTLTLFFSIPKEGRTLVRSLERAAGRDSATLEAAALIVRSVLRALATGATIGVTLAKPLDIPAAPDSAPVVPRPVLTPPTPPEAEAPAQPLPRDRLGWLVSAGWHSAMCGSNVWLQGVEARGGVSHGPLALGVQLSLDAPTELTDRYATVRLSRGTATAFGAVAIPAGQAVRLGVAVGAGAAGFPRQSVDVAPGVSRAPDAWNVSAILAGEVGASVRWSWQGAFWGFALRAGADAVLAPPTIGYDVGGAFVAVHTLWTVQPKAVLALEAASY